jgi:glycosyltransferase involved in cell wall biosynthesis
VKKVAILTDFGSPDPSYSLNIIAEEQLGMLHRAGYQPVGIVEEGFKPERNWNLAELRTIPRVDKDNVINLRDGWQTDVNRIRKVLDDVLRDVHVVLTHDMIYQCAELWLNMAARQFQKGHPRTTWLNWVHSASPSPVWRKNKSELFPVQSHFPHSKTIFPNDYDVPRIARNFRCEIDDICVVPHPTDICSYLGFQPITTKLIQEKSILSADAILVYPIRLDRGKQVQYVLRTAAAIKRLGRSTRVIIVDFHSTGGDKVTYREYLIGLCAELGLNEIDVTFTSQYDESLWLSAPRSVVRDLMLLCNVFVLPSRSETYSLIAQEAALCGAMLILNFDFPPIRSVYGPAAAYYKFSSNINVNDGQDGSTDTKYGSIDAYFKDIALRVLYELDNNIILSQQRRIRQTRNPDYIFKHHIEPIFHCFDGRPS